MVTWFRGSRSPFPPQTCRVVVANLHLSIRPLGHQKLSPTLPYDIISTPIARRRNRHLFSFPPPLAADMSLAQATKGDVPYQVRSLVRTALLASPPMRLRSHGRGRPGATAAHRLPPLMHV